MAVGTAILVVGVVVGDAVLFVGLLGVAPVAAAAFSSPLPTTTASTYTAVIGLAGVVVADQLGDAAHQIRLGGLAVACLTAVAVSYSRQRREERLAKFETATRGLRAALHRPLPERVGNVTVASAQLVSDTETDVGGDVLEITTSPFGTRVLVADARGHGASAVRLAAGITMAFRESSLQRRSMTEIAADLDAVVTEVSLGEEFATAVLMEIHGDRVTVLNLGHPAPIHVTAGGARSLTPAQRQPPLGVPGPRDVVAELHLAEGDVVLCYTDGIVEARSAHDGLPFDLMAAVATHVSDDPEPMLSRLIEAVCVHTDGEIADDMTLLAVQRERDAARTPPDGTVLRPGAAPSA